MSRILLRFAQECQVDVRKGVTTFDQGHPIVYPPKPEDCPTRGEITGFSTKSAKRLRYRVHALGVAPEHFITLTYPSEFPHSPETWKKHLDNFTRELRRSFKNCWFFWKLEPQKRGAPHYHLLGSFGRKSGNVTLLRNWVKYIWYRIVGSNDPKHLEAGTGVEIVTTPKKCRQYVSKYLSKSISDLPDWARPGRFWGVVQKEKVPVSDYYSVQLTAGQFVSLRRLVKRWLKSTAHQSCIKYANRLHSIPIFKIFLDWGTIAEMIRFVTSPLKLNGGIQNECSAIPF